ncbi:DUF3810 domain-containing protein [Urechidicola sp. KH5]
MSSNPGIVEEYYSNSFYVLISSFSRNILGRIPISVGDVFYITIGYYMIKSIYKVFKTKCISLLKIGAYLSLIYGLFHICWGLNYYRIPLYQQLELESLKYETKELKELTFNLVDAINTTHFNITQNDTVKVTVPYSKKELYEKVQIGYNNLTNHEPSFSYKNPAIKNSIMSLPLSYMGFSGYLNPITNEAQVNYLIPRVNYPATSCHEVAHQLGYAAENDANFIGFLAASKHSDAYFNYSAYYMALRYTLNDLYHHDKEAYKLAFKSLNKGIIKNMHDSRKHWEKYKNPFEVIFKKIFNQFLKANKQNAGIKSYSLMVGMLINYEKQYQTLFDK